MENEDKGYKFMKISFKDIEKEKSEEQGINF
ncbi:hypothetical protein Stok01_02047 [Sulfurisphaera tokodaii]